MELASSPGAVIRAAVPADTRQISRLLNKARYSHYHLDWHLPVDLIGSPAFVVAEDQSAATESTLAGCLAAVVDPSPASWVRLAAVRNDRRLSRLLGLMIETVSPALLDSGAEVLGWLATDAWPNEHLPSFGFQRQNWIETFLKDEMSHPAYIASDVEVHPAKPEDMPDLALIEEAAFEPLWRHSASGLQRALSQSIVFDVAELSGRKVGFQYCVRAYEHAQAHLVRLTVHPETQGRGVGSALLTSLLNNLSRQGIRRVSLNTQADNVRSHRLYERFGFQRLGERVPLWMRVL